MNTYTAIIKVNGKNKTITVKRPDHESALRRARIFLDEMYGSDWEWHSELMRVGR